MRRLFEILRDAVSARMAGYFLFFVLALLIFVLARFPVNTVIPKVIASIPISPYEIAFDHSGLTFPPGVHLDQVSLSGTLMGKKMELLQADTVELSPSLLSFLMGDMGGSISATLLGGDLFIAGTSGDDGIEITFEGEKLNPSASPIWQDGKWGGVDGAVNFAGSMSVPKGDITKGNGGATVEMGKGVLTLPRAVSSILPYISIEESALELSYKNGRVMVNKGVLNGDGIDATLSGAIILSKVINYSRLNLTAKIRFESDMEKKLAPFISFLKKDRDGSYIARIGGTITAPILR